MNIMLKLSKHFIQFKLIQIKYYKMLLFLSLYIYINMKYFVYTIHIFIHNEKREAISI